MTEAPPALDVWRLWGHHASLPLATTSVRTPMATQRLLDRFCFILVILVGCSADRGASNADIDDTGSEVPTAADDASDASAVGLLDW